MKSVVQDLTSAGSSDTDSFMEELKELALLALSGVVASICKKYSSEKSDN